VFFAGPDTRPSKKAASPAHSPAPLESLLRRATVKRLPILFVRQSEAKHDHFIAAARHCGIPGLVVDQDDVVAVYRVASEALAHARRGNGPTLVDSKPWRLKGGGRKPRDTRDAIGKMETYLDGKGLAYKSLKNAIQKKFAAQLEHAGNAFAGVRKT
jgi:TPP-dependent pyruvate/acetoin dehydrogenase alpha subunit